ncbi:hypothetical protein JZ751_011393 [Albula glossodonta]|uniref:Uncharacterized protein n=1 Tax=Albula glossodonta TaxID=121402 RepID=A0A8T2N102_9TELE|nr:hypothetical protein JZ751_011393 [Albula glossodonta]
MATIGVVSHANFLRDDDVIKEINITHVVKEGSEKADASQFELLKYAALGSGAISTGSVCAVIHPTVTKAGSSTEFQSSGLYTPEQTTILSDASAVLVCFHVAGTALTGSEKAYAHNARSSVNNHTRCKDTALTLQLSRPDSP